MVTPGLLFAILIAAVGREGVLASANAREARCGRRLVSGLFSRPRLPLGYSYVTTVPRGACRLNVSEIVPSENFIALKISNSSYIMNGEFAVSAPGTYEAAGARFLYSRPGGLDSVFALGPIQYPIDIMVLYTQPNPSIRYAYFTESQPGQLDSESITKTSLLDGLPSGSSKHTRRHHSFDQPHSKSSPSIPRYPSHANASKEYIDEDIEEKYVGGRKFIWKIMSYTQCSRTCGGGIQVGKFRCAEVSNGIDKEVSSVHCSGSPPAARRRRCGNIPCPPRWRAAAWSTCPQCGPASRTRIVGCVQDHARGITKISDQKCPAPKPITTEICNIPNCSGMKQSETKRVIRPREHIDAFHDGPVYSIAVNSSDDIGPVYEFNGASAGWLYTEWSECVGWCVGGGLQTRGVRCADPSSCIPRSTPASTNVCTPKLPCEPHEGQWFTGEWSNCTSKCGGKQVRGVLCIGGSGRHLRDSACKGPRPEHERDCGDDCTPTWYFSDWSVCTGNCTSGIGVQRRMVWCSRGEQNGSGDAVVEDKHCGGRQPTAQRACTLTCKTTESTIPPDLSIESQKTSENELVDTEEIMLKGSDSKDCEDKLANCGLAVQARLCHYKYYINNCCSSCKGR